MKKYIPIVFLMVFRSVFLPAAVNGLSQDYIFRTFSPEGGFYYDGITSICQDRDGFIWVVMDNALLRFDGYEYKNYHATVSEIDESIGWSYYNIQTDTTGRLLVRTNNGVFAYEKETDNFQQVFRAVDFFTVDSRNHFWVREQGHLSVLEADTLFTPAATGGPTALLGNVTCTYEDEFYVFSNYGSLFRYDYVQREFKWVLSIPALERSVVQACTYEDKLWVMVRQGTFFKIDLKTYSVEDRIDLFPDQGVTVRSFEIGGKGNLWVGTINGLYVVDPSTKEYSVHYHSNENPFSLPNNSVWTVQKDRQDNLWIGTYAGGMAYVNTSETHPFKSYFPQEEGLSLAPVSGFAEDERYFWIATEGGGLNRMDKNSREFSVLRHTFRENSLSYDNIKSIATDQNNNLWIAMFTGGLDFYDIKNDRFTHYKRRPGDRSSLENNNLRKIVVSPDQKGLWVAYQTPRAVVSYLDFSTHKFTHYEADGKDNSYVFDFVYGPDDKLWIITSNYLYRMNIEDRSFDKIILDSTKCLYARSVCTDPSGMVWVGTQTNGLYCYDPHEGTSRVIQKMDDRDIPSVYSLRMDDEGFLWLGTDDGLFRYDRVHERFLRFDSQHGAQGRVYYPLASYKARDGRLFVGGTNGFTIIEPRKVVSNPYTPRVSVSDFYIDNRPVRMKLTLSRKEKGVSELVLNHNEINFGFRFSSDNYLMPEKNLFRYRLRGYDNRWIVTDASNRTAMYSKVPPGTYYFEIVAANNDGLWNETPTIIKIRRKAAPWASTTAYVFYVLAALSVFGLILYHYRGKQKLRMQLYLEGLEKDKKEELHQSQLRFFTNISHDFRTPISLISATIDRLREDGIKEYYHNILNSNTKRLLNLVNELMDFRTIETGKMSLKPAPENVSTLLHVIAGDFFEYASQKNLDFRIDIDPLLPKMVCVDRSILEKIVINLLQNAFRYTREGGLVALEAYVAPERFSSRYAYSFMVGEECISREMFLIAVRDTGVGITPESIQSVFERFYKVNTTDSNAHLGTGIGLALVKSLVLLHRGSITIFSERGKGTDMVVALPLEREFYVENGLLEEETVSGKETDGEPEIKMENPVHEVLRREKKQILLAEDNEDLRKLIAESLSGDYHVIEVPDGQEALEVIQKTDIELIISDIIMPLKNGIELCREVKENIETSHIPFMLITARTGLDSKLEGADSGADIYFEKPVDLGLLKISIQNLFRHQQQLKEYYSQNYYADSSELSQNQQDNEFLKKLVDVIEENLGQSQMDVNSISSELCMSRSKLYTKVKKLTGKSPVEFILNYRLRKAAKMIIEKNMTMREIMSVVGIESQAYFTNSFKKEFGMTPTAFAAKHKKSEE